MGARRLEGCGADGHFLDRLHLQRGFLKNASVLLFCCSLFCYAFCVGQRRPGRTRESQGKRFFVFRFFFFCILHFLFRPGKARGNQGRPAIFVFFRTLWEQILDLILAYCLVLTLNLASLPPWQPNIKSRLSLEVPCMESDFSCSRGKRFFKSER